MPADTSDVSDRFGGMSVRNLVEARACTPAALRAFAGGMLFKPVRTVS